MGTLALPSRLPVTAMRTYGAVAPLKTHWRAATCAEVECQRYLHGWSTVVDRVARPDVIAAVRASGRRPQRVTHDGNLTTFHFAAGTPCFEADTHRIRLDRPELYVVRGGDWRANTGIERRHTRAADWVEEFRTHNDKLITTINKG